MKQNRTIIGLTGGVGTGKTTLLRMMEKKYKAVVFVADDIGHEAMKPGTETYERICNLFGPKVVNEDQTINRNEIASIIFEHPDKKEKMNAIIHPFVWQYIWKRIDELPEHSLVIIESAILFEAGYAKECTMTWGMVTPERLRRERLIRERQYTKEKIEQIEKNQLTKEELSKKCDYIIINAGDLAFLDSQIRKIMV